MLSSDSDNESEYEFFCQRISIFFRLPILLNSFTNQCVLFNMIYFNFYMIYFNFYLISCYVANHENSNRRSRGPTQATLLAKVWNRTGPPKAVELNAYNQRVDDGELAKFCRTITRNPALTPLEYADWRNVPGKKKD